MARSPAPQAAALTLLVVALLGCTEPALLPDGTADEEVEPAPVQDPLDTAAEEFTAQLEVVRDTVSTAIERLTAASEASSLPAARSEGEAALALLLDDPDTSGSAPALLPAASTDREEAGAQDVGLTTLLTLARDVGGPLGQQTVEVLRDPIAGDLGAWERDAAGVVDGVRQTIAGGHDLDELEAAIRELPGDATRALAWTLLASQADDRDTAAAYAQRAAVHLEFVLAALDQLADSAAESGG